MRKSTPSYHQKKMFPVQQPPQVRKPHFQRGDKVNKGEPSEVVCYGCGTPGVIKPKCPSCKGKDKRNHGTFSRVILQSASCPSKQLATLEVTINGVMESEADGSKTEREVNTTYVKIRLGGRTLPLNLVAIPGAKNNNTLLGGEAYPFIEHYIDTQNHPPVSVPPYRVSAARKDTMKNEIDRLLNEGIIEPCESPYAAPVVLITKTDGTTRQGLARTARQIKSFADQKRRPAPSYTSGDLVLVTKPNQSNKNADSPKLPVGVYHTSALTPFQENVIPPVKTLRRRGRPARIIKPSSPSPANTQIHKGSQNTSSADPWSGRLRDQRGRL
ncbi:retrovirus-related Pol polyprotein from transposon 17.6 [Nephila pilipes]|uniref:Retrovirus-related Pol polyprotein from transposon 17.6 n=1 Tax=Nephila pilipes TaxID=299642 RepID=A0A8X6MN62_NEPPI|nr:retrovirus-related Pol polyprotein from transposon 17.6 [Nephila pilipes]